MLSTSKKIQNSCNLFFGVLFERMAQNLYLYVDEFQPYLKEQNKPKFFRLKAHCDCFDKIFNHALNDILILASQEWSWNGFEINTVKFLLEDSQREPLFYIYEQLETSKFLGKRKIRYNSLVKLYLFREYFRYLTMEAVVHQKERARRIYQLINSKYKFIYLTGKTSKALDKYYNVQIKLYLREIHKKNEQHRSVNSGA